MEKVEQQSVMENLSADAKRERESFYSLKNLSNKSKIKKCCPKHKFVLAVSLLNLNIIFLKVSLKKLVLIIIKQERSC